MTVLHATEPATVYLSLWARVDGLDRRRRRPGALRRPHPGQAARDAAHPLRLPARPAARPPGGAPRPGWPTQLARPAGQGGRGGRASPTTARPGSTRREAARARRAWPDGAALTAPAAARGRCPELDGPARPRARQEVRRQRPDRAAGAHPARRRGRDRPRPQRRPLAALQAALDADGGLAGRRTAEPAEGRRGVRRAGRAAGCAPSAPAPRPTWCGGSGATKARRPARRWPTSAPSRCRSTAAAPAGCCPTTSTRSADGRAVGGAAAGARPDGDGLEGARLLPRRRTRRRSSTRNGNAGTTAWWDGRVVGCWVQDDDGVVGCALLRGRRRPPPGAALDAEAERLTAWLDGVRVGTVYPSLR